MLVKDLKNLINNIGFTYSIIGEYPDYSTAKTEEKRLKVVVKKASVYCPICKGIKNEKEIL